MQRRSATMEIDPFSMLELSLQEEPESEPIGISCEPPQENALGNAPHHNAMQKVIINGNKLATVSNEEGTYRRKVYKILRKRLHCTICDVHVGCRTDLIQEEIEHPLLKVLTCSRCSNMYKYINFPLNPEGRDIRCRWCTNPSSEDSPLRFCTYCPFAFCEMCIYRNMPLDELARKNAWTCFVCNIEELWPARAISWALSAQMSFNASRAAADRWQGDVSSCCSNKKIEVKNDQSTSKFGNRNAGRKVANGTRGKSMAVANVGKITKVMPNRIKIPPKPVVLAIKNSPSLKALERHEKPKPLPASKYETFWLTDKINNVTTTLQTLIGNLQRVSGGIPEVDDKFNIKSKMISLTSLLNIGSNQITNFTKELETDWKKVLETKSYKTVNKGLRRYGRPPLAPAVKSEPADDSEDVDIPDDKIDISAFGCKPFAVRIVRCKPSDYED